MEILSKLNGVPLSIPCDVDYTNNLLAQVFQAATLDTSGLMDVEGFNKIILYPIEGSVIRKAFGLHFDKTNDGYIDQNAFITAGSALEKRRKQQRLDDLMELYVDNDGMITFSDFRCLLRIAMLQMSFCFHEDDLGKLAVLILKRQEYRYASRYVLARLEAAKLDTAFSDIFFTRLLTFPKKQIAVAYKDRPIVRVKQWSTKFLLLTLAIYLSFVLCVVYLFAVNGEHHRHTLHTLNSVHQYWQAALRLHRTAGLNFTKAGKFESLTDAVELEWLSVWRNISTELVNVNFTLVVIVSLKSFQIMVRKPPLCGYAYTQDIRTIWWSIVVLTACSLISEFLSKCCGLPMELDEQDFNLLQINSLFIRKHSHETVASFLKLLLFSVFFSVRMVASRGAILPYAKDVTDILLYFAMMLHVVQELSFLKWMTIILLFFFLDYYLTRSDKLYNQRIPILSCTTLKEQHIITVRNKFAKCRPGDFMLVSLDGFAVNAAVPAWVISYSRRDEFVRLRLQSEDWQTEILRRYVNRIKPASKSQRSKRSGKLRNLEAGMKKIPEVEKEQMIVVFNRNLEHGTDIRKVIDCQESIPVILDLGLSSRVYGPFRGVRFEDYENYGSILLLVTPSSAGAVASFLSKKNNNCKVHLILAAKQLCGVEWFIKLLVELEIQESQRRERHRLKSQEKSPELPERRQFLRIFLIPHKGINLLRDTSFVLSLALQILAGREAHRIGDLLNSIDLECKLGEGSDFFNVDFILGDLQYPKIGSIAANASRLGTAVELRSF